MAGQRQDESARTLIENGRIVTPKGVLDDAVVGVESGRIAFVGAVPPGFAGEHVDAQGGWIVPGLIETHVHGALHHDVMDAGQPEVSLEAGRDAILAIGSQLARHGVTAWLPTTVACSAPALGRILEAVAAAREVSESVLGAHLESNFLAPQYKGAQPEAWLRTPDDAELREVLAAHRDILRVVTLAPELPGALACIRTLVGWGVVVAVGHTDATYDQVLEAVEAGARRITHLCNAQRPFHHREPGVVGAGLTCDELYAEIIADLVHVHPAGLVMARRCKGPHKLMLVSDALRGSGLPPGTYELGGQPTTLDGQVARLADGTIAGSVIGLDRAIANMVNHAGTSPADAFAMASSTPAASLGLTDRGALVPGYRADIALFDPNFRCKATMIGGTWATCQEETT